MSDSSRPGSDDRQGPPVPPAPPVPPTPPAPPVHSGGTPAPPAPPAYAGGTPAAPGQAARDSALPAYGTPLPPAPTAAPPQYAYVPAPTTVPKTLSLTGMILGIVGLVISIFGWGFGFILSAPAIVLGFLGRRREPGARGLALTAIITGIAGVVISLIYLAVTIVLLVLALNAASSPGGL